LFQLFRVPTTGGDPIQLTFDATDKTQPSVSADGREIAFTVFHFSTQFWAVDP
jgi:Tol biopolymer transport system component